MSFREANQNWGKESIKNKKGGRYTMHYKQIEPITKKILNEVYPKHLFSYQIFNRIAKLDPTLAAQLRHAYGPKKKSGKKPMAKRPMGKKPMGEGVGTNFSPANFISKALNAFKKKPEYSDKIKRAWVDSSDITIEDIEAGNKDSLEIFAWKK